MLTPVVLASRLWDNLPSSLADPTAAFQRLLLHGHQCGLLRGVADTRGSSPCPSISFGGGVARAQVPSVRAHQRPARWQFVLSGHASVESARV